MLEILLDRYQHSAGAEKNRYLIKEEFEQLRLTLAEVDALLSELESPSLKWEQIE
jgi:hypothetical protein